MGILKPEPAGSVSPPADAPPPNSGSHDCLMSVDEQSNSPACSGASVWKISKWCTADEVVLANCVTAMSAASCSVTV